MIARNTERPRQQHEVCRVTRNYAKCIPEPDNGQRRPSDQSENLQKKTDYLPRLLKTSTMEAMA